MHSYLEGSSLKFIFAAGGYQDTIQEIRRVLYSAKASVLRASFDVSQDLDLDKQLKELQGYAIYLETLANEPDEVFDQDPSIREQAWALAAQCYEYLAGVTVEWLPPSALLHLRACLCYSKAGLSSNAALLGGKVDATMIGIRVPEPVLAYLRRDYMQVEKLAAVSAGQFGNAGVEDFPQLLDGYLWKNVLQALDLHVRAIRRGFSHMDRLLEEQVMPLFKRALVFAGRLSSFHYWFVDDIASMVELVHHNSVRANLTGLLRPEYLDVLTGTSRLPGLPAPIIELWPSQKHAIDQGFIRDGVGHRIISMPTSAGKTLLCELAIVRALEEQEEATCIYVVPTRALVRQVEGDLGRRLNPLGLTVSSALGDFEFVDVLDDYLLKRARVVVVTPERLSSLIRRQAGFLLTTSLVIYDEFHKIAEEQRGMIQEETLIALRSLVDLGVPLPRLIICSAVMSKVKELQDWLAQESLNGATAVVTSWRPTRSLLSVCWHEPYGDWQPEGRKRQEKKSELRYENHKLAARSSLSMVFPDLPRIRVSPHTISGIFKFKLTTRLYDRSGRTSEPTADVNASDIAVYLAKILAGQPGTILVYSPRPIWAVALAKRLAEALPVQSDAPWVERLGRTLTDRHPLITKLAPKGVAYHHGSVPDEVREAIEETTGAKGIKVLVATPSLLEGVNLPITHLIIAQPIRFKDKRAVPLDLRSFLNLVGRAGRALRETEGSVILIEDPTHALAGNHAYERFIGLSNAEASRQLEVHSYLEKLLTVSDQALAAEDNEVVEQLKTMVMAFEGLGLEPSRIASKSLAAAYLQEDAEAVEKLFERASVAVNQVVNDQDIKKLFSISGLPLRDCRQLYAKLAETVISQPHSFSSVRTSDGRISANVLDVLLELTVGLEGTRPKRQFETMNHAALLDSWLHGGSMPELASMFLETGKSVDTAATDEVEEAVSQCVDYVGDFIRYKLPWAVNAIVLFWAALTADNEEAEVDEEFVYLPAYIKAGVSTRAGAACATLGIRDRIVAETVGRAYHERYTLRLFSVRHFIQWFNRLDIPQVEQLALDSFGKALLLQATRRYAGRLIRAVSKHHRAFVVGLQYYHPELLSEIRAGAQLTLRPQPTNAVDPNAVEVYYRDVKLGYVQKEEAPAVFSWLEDDLVIEAKVAALATSGSMNRRISMDITLLENFER